MRVAIAGSGAFAKYFAEELPAAGHQVVILTRTHKPFFDGKPGVLEQRITEYKSGSALAGLLNDCDALVSTVADYSNYVNIHLNMIEACKQTPKCKRFIPSEYGGNAKEIVAKPSLTNHGYIAVKEALRAQSELEWTVFSIGWLLNYIVPAANRYHSEIGPLHALNLNANTITIPGTGHEVFSTTSARDVAKAVAQMLKSPTKWRQMTYVQGQETTWLQMAEVMKTRGGMPDLKIVFEPLDEVRAVLERNESMDAAVMAEFKLFVPDGKIAFDQSKVQRDRDELFPNLHFCTIDEALEAVKKNPSVVV